MVISREPERSSGTYVLILRNARQQHLEVGSLGQLVFAPGIFAYVGSAFGPGGVAARCGHHRRISERPHWHIDYLRAATTLEQIWYSHDLLRREHQWSGLLARSRGASRPHPGFGASDCGCHSHLFHYSSVPSFDGFRRRARRELQGQMSIRVEKVA
jgi:Uri superfamily endonuclease